MDLDGTVPCDTCRITRVIWQRGKRSICTKCDELLHRWNRKLYSSTPVISSREYISRGRPPKR